MIKKPNLHGAKFDLKIYVLTQNLCIELLF